MKSRIRICSSSSSIRSPPSTFCRYYLKPGALAQFRNSKITAKFKAKENLNFTQISLYKLKPTSELTLRPSISDMEAIPCFAFSFKNNRSAPRCLVRKKLIAVTPIFSEL